MANPYAPEGVQFAVAFELLASSMTLPPSLEVFRHEYELANRDCAVTPELLARRIIERLNNDED